MLMPGPLTSAHGGIEKCSACHTKSGEGKLSWVKGLTAGDPHADSKACLTCHKMPDTAFNAHGASAETLKRSTERLLKTASQTPAPFAAEAQNRAFPAKAVLARDLTCATCHQEHQGANFSLGKISNEQCRSCHVVKFDSFDGNHPKFDSYPFDRRTRIVFDHSGHFNKHYPEVAKKEPSKRIPETCSACHNSRDDKRIMSVAPFDQNCSTCHLDQITGKERASGPKGIAFLSVPGLDLSTLRSKNAAIGEWPEESEAALTPFMIAMIGRSEQGRALIETAASLNLQDLSGASEDQIKAVSDLVWEIKDLFYALIAGKASDVLGNLNVADGAKLSPGLVADLTAGIPRDAVIGAQQQWLPNLARELAVRKGLAPPETAAAAPEATAEETVPAEANSSAGNETVSSSEPKSDGSEPSEGTTAATTTQAVKRDPPPCMMRLFGQCLFSKGQQAESEAAAAKPDGGAEASAAQRPPGAMRAGLQDVANAEPQRAEPQSKASQQSDELLQPTEEEQREINARKKGGGKAARPDGTSGPAAASSATPSPQTRAAPAIQIASEIDPESWAEYGGWYRQDHAIFYRPAGHKDKFIYSWLFLTGPQAPRDGKGPAAAVFNSLTGKDAQGSCTKCHSIDDLQSKGRVVNFSPETAASKQGSFTAFVHEPHFGTMDDRGCLTCHKLEKLEPGQQPAQTNAGIATEQASDPAASDAAAKSVSPYLKSYDHGDPRAFASNFGAVKKDLCQTCHTASKARQDCLTCHKYHVNGVVTPITATKLPTQ